MILLTICCYKFDDGMDYYMWAEEQRMMFYVALLRGYACPCTIYTKDELLLVETDAADVVKGCFMVVFTGK